MITDKFDEFVNKWLQSERPEQASSKEQILNLCRVLSFPEPVDIDKVGDNWALETRVLAGFKENNQPKHNWADASLVGHFVWEYKSAGVSLKDAYYNQILPKYRSQLDNPPLSVTSDMNTFQIYTEFENTAQHIYEFDLEALGKNEPNLLGNRRPQDVLYALFYDPDYLRPTNSQPKFSDETAYKAWRERQLITSRVFSNNIPARPKWELEGRSELVAILKKQLLHNPSTSIALWGMPGVGKTAIPAFMVNDEELREHFFGGILWARLGQQANVLAELTEWAKLLRITDDEIVQLTSYGDTNKNTKSLSQAIQSKIGQQRMLVVIDDVWEIEHAQPFIVGSRCSHLITTRRRSIAESPFAKDAHEIKELTVEQGFSLLKLIAAKVVEGAPAVANELVEAVYGLPLALVIIGSYLKVKGQPGRNRPRLMNEALSYVQDPNNRLELKMILAPGEQHPSLPDERELSLLASIALSYNALETDDQRHTLSSLSVFPPKPKGFSEEGALYVSQASTENLDVLNDYSLLEDDGNFYTMHPVVQEYVRVKAGDLKPYHARAAEYYLSTYKHDPDDTPPQFLADVQPLLDAFDQQCAAHLFSDAAFNLAGKGLAYKPDGQQLVLNDLLVRWGEYQSLVDIGKRLAKAPTGSLSEQTRGAMLGNFGIAYERLGRYDLAREYIRQSLDIAEDEAMVNWEGVSAILGNLAHLAFLEGKLDAAEELYDSAINALSQIEGQRPDLESNHLNGIGSVYRAKGLYSEALDAYNQARGIATNTLDAIVLANSLSNIANIYADLALSEYDADLRRQLQEAAISNYQQANEIAETNRDIVGIARHQGNISAIYHDMGKYIEALQYGGRALSTFRQIADLQGQAIQLGNVGVALLMIAVEDGLTKHKASLQGDTVGTYLNLRLRKKRKTAPDDIAAFEQAAGDLLKALKLATDVGDAETQTRQWWNLSVAYLCMGKYTYALACAIRGGESSTGPSMTYESTAEDGRRSLINGFIEKVLEPNERQIVISTANQLVRDPNWMPL